jgi:hypothetical protein
VNFIDQTTVFTYQEKKHFEQIKKWRFVMALHFVHEQRLRTLSNNVFMGGENALKVFLDAAKVNADAQKIRSRLLSAETEARLGTGTNGEFVAGPTRKFLDACIVARSQHPEVSLRVLDDLSITP